MAVEIKGLEEALRKLRGLGSAVTQHAAKAVYREAEEVMRDSKENYVPVVTGTLRRSGFVQPPEVGPGGFSVRLGYGGPAAPYAFAVHENPNAGQSAKGSRVGQWKYLEQPLMQAQEKIRRAITSAIGDAFKKG